MDALPDPRMRKKGYSFVSFPVSWLDDRPVAQLPHDALGVYVRLYLLAGRFNESGILQDEHGTLELGDLAYLLRCGQEELEKLMSLLESLSLIDKIAGAWRVKSFTEEQINLNERRAKWARARQEQRQKAHKPEKENYPNIDSIKKEEGEIDGKWEEKEEEPEVEEERPDGVLKDTQKTTAASTSATLAGASVAFSGAIHSNRLFQDTYNLAKKQGLAFNTAAILRGITYMKDFVAYHNEMTGDHWSSNNPAMVVEFCDVAMMRDRWYRECESLNNRGLWDETKMPEYLKPILGGDP